MNTVVYIGFPLKTSENVSTDTLKGFIGNLIDSLKKYYDMPIEVKTYRQNKYLQTAVHVMNGAKYPNMEPDITNEITVCVKRCFDMETKVFLDYSRMNPKFNPLADVSAAKSPVANSNDNDNGNGAGSKKSEEFDYERLSYNYQAEEPHFSFEQVILPEKTITQIIEAVGIIEVETKVFDEWGLRSIIPTATSAISFYGAPGTGKTMAAEAIAQKLGKKILKATYADIESKYHGEGPKMVKAIFRSAERDNAILFLDESDSLLSKRLTNVSDGSGQAINSMRSQLLISLETFRGIVIFATNLVINYDKAFVSRLINIEFPQPDEKCREKIWRQHLVGGENSQLRIPLGSEIDFGLLARDYDFCGRDIRNSVKSACVTVALEKRESVTQEDLIFACEKTKEDSLRVMQTDDHTKSSIGDHQNNLLKTVIQQKLNENSDNMG